MSIRIKRNNEGNCINFEGSSNPTYWNACLSGEVDGELPNTVNIINDIQTAQTGEVQYEFFRIPYTEFEDKDGNLFDSASATAAYITENANVIGLDTVGIDLTNTDVGFRLDDTSTSIIFDNGFNFGVNTIKAVADADGTIHIHAVGSGVPTGDEEANSKKHFQKLNHTRVSVAGAPVSGGLNDVVNTLNELFTAGPFAAVVISDPNATLIPNLTGTEITGNLAGNTIDPSGPDIAARGPGDQRFNDSGWLSNDTISHGGEYFTFNVIVPDNPNAGYFFGMGLVNALSSQTIGNQTYGDPANFATNTNNSTHAGFQWSNWWHTSPNGPLEVYGADAGYIQGPGWTSFASSDEGVGFENAGPVTVKVGIDFNGFIEIGYYDLSEGLFVQIARSDYPVLEGDEFKLGVKFSTSNGARLGEPKVHLRNIDDPIMHFRTIESPDGLWHFPLFLTEEEANFYDLNHDGTVGSGTSHTRVYPDDPTNTVWYMPDTGATLNSTSRPQLSPGTFKDAAIVYTEITSLTNQDLKPPAFQNTTITVNERAAVNIAVNPADHSWTTSITDNENSGFVLNGTGENLIGTSPDVTDDNVSNPNDVYTHTITRTNTYGTSTGTLTVIVNNLTAPVFSAITGFEHVSGSTDLAGTNTLDSGSVVKFDETLDNEQRFIILQSYVETHILPSLQSTGDKYYVGVLNSGTDVTSISASDFELAFVWEYDTISSHTYSVIQDGTTLHTSNIGSVTDSYYDYAIEVNGANAWMIGCNVDAINTEPSPTYGGSFSNATSAVLGESLPLELVVSYTGGNTADFSLSGISEIVIPAPDNWIQVTSDGSNVLSFDGLSSLTIEAGNTYKFLMDDIVYADQTTATQLSANDVLRFTADGSTEYTTGINRVGTPGVDGSYVEFTVPLDVPPLQWYTDHSGVGSTNGINIAGSTYSVTVTGITLEGPSANQTGTNLNDAGDHGWLSIDEPLGAGQRLVLTGAFLADLADAMGDNNIVSIGLKDGAWVNTIGNAIPSGMEGDMMLNIYRISSTNFEMYGYNIATGTLTTKVIGTHLYNSSQFLNYNAFIEVTSSGNNIRVGHALTNSHNANTETYQNWSSSSKVQTGDQGFGITGLDVMFKGFPVSGSTDTTDADDIDWTALSEISVPVASTVNTTNWTKAIDFSGSNEHLKQVSNLSFANALRLDHMAVAIAAPTLTTKTSSAYHAKPWATSVVFDIDNNTSNQVIWNQGGGANNGNTNIYLKVNNKRLYFGWGKEGTGYNECTIMPLPSAPNGYLGHTAWYGVYIAHNGTRLVPFEATASNLAAAFDIRLMNSAGNNWTLGSNLSVPAAWTSTGYSMTERVDDEFSIGGMETNRSFQGEIASMVITTLKKDVDMPTNAEIEKMVKDPTGWLADYKVGNSYRYNVNNSSNFQTGVLQPSLATQVWLMGDGASDSYFNGIRNQVYSAEQNYGKLQLNSMVSNDIQNVSIPGLS